MARSGKNRSICAESRGLARKRSSRKKWIKHKQKNSGPNANINLQCKSISNSKWDFLNGSLNSFSKDISRLQRVFDPVFITVLFILIQPTYIVWTSPFASIPFWCIVAAVTTAVLSRQGTYSSHRFKSLRTVTRQITSNWILVVSILLFAAYVDKSTASFSRVATSLWAISGWLWLMTTHVWFRSLLHEHRRRGGNSRSIVYWGPPEAAIAFAEEIAANRWMGLRIVSWFSPVPPAPNNRSQNLPTYGGGINQLRAWLSCNKADRLIFSDSSISANQICALFGDTSIPVAYAPCWSHSTMKFTVESIGQQPCIELWGEERSLLDRYIKRIFDLILGTTSVVLLLPVFAIVAVAVRISSPGPILFKQDRYGLDGKPFKCYKFRSMSVQKAEDENNIKQATLNDPRVTKIGSILRKWSLDEIPQLFNVLQGDMSLVGPRPHAVQHNEMYRKMIPGYMQRHAFKPGITGLAQVSGWRGETRTLLEMEERINADLRYQRDWNLQLDIKILLKTILNIRSGNAY